MATKKSELSDSPVSLTITARRDGFRRCGMVFGRLPVEVTVTPEQAEILHAEPMLTVEAAS